MWVVSARLGKRRGWAGPSPSEPGFAGERVGDTSHRQYVSARALARQVVSGSSNLTRVGETSAQLGNYPVPSWGRTADASPWRLTGKHGSHAQAPGSPATWMSCGEKSIPRSRSLSTPARLRVPVWLNADCVAQYLKYDRPTVAPVPAFGLRGKIGCILRALHRLLSGDGMFGRANPCPREVYTAPTLRRRTGRVTLPALSPSLLPQVVALEPISHNRGQNRGTVGPEGSRHASQRAALIDPVRFGISPPERARARARLSCNQRRLPVGPAGTTWGW